MKKNNVVKIKSTDFAVRIIQLVKHLTQKIPYAEHAICTQLLKSGTSIGANVAEAEQAQSKADFISKLQIRELEFHRTRLTIFLNVFIKWIVQEIERTEERE